MLSICSQEAAEEADSSDAEEARRQNDWARVEADQIEMEAASVAKVEAESVEARVNAAVDQYEDVSSTSEEMIEEPESVDTEAGEKTENVAEEALIEKPIATGGFSIQSFTKSLTTKVFSIIAFPFVILNLTFDHIYQFLRSLFQRK